MLLAAPLLALGLGTGCGDDGASDDTTSSDSTGADTNASTSTSAGADGSTGAPGSDSTGVGPGSDSSGATPGSTGDPATSSGSGSDGTGTGGSDSTGGAALMTEEVAIVDGDVTISARITTVEGDAPTRTLVLVHGGPGFSDDYMHPLEQAAMVGWRVVSYDQHGSGDSTGPTPADWSLARYVADVEAVRNHVGEPQVHLFGHSWGALVSWAYLDAHPAEVASIAVLGGLPAAVTPGVFAAFGDLDARIVALQGTGEIPDPIPEDVGDDCTPSSQAVYPAYVFDPSAALPAPFLATSCSDASGAGTNLALNMAGGWDFTAAVGTYAGDAAVWWGDADPLGINFGPDTTPQLLSATVQETVLVDTGHYPWLEGYDFVGELQAWMDTQP